MALVNRQWPPQFQKEDIKKCETTFLLDDSLDWLDGHFHTKPIMPGVAILKAAWRFIEAVEQNEGFRISPIGMRRVRFRKLIEPPTRMTISLSERAKSGKIIERRFCVVEDGANVAGGLFQYSRK